MYATFPRRELGVDVEDGFTPSYEVMEDKKKLIRDIRRDSKNASNIYLATDPDREGEAIAWHLVHSAGLEKRPLKRVVFHEITEDALKEAFEQPRDIDLNLVNAQQTRRILDRLVGYKLSPVLWQKVVHHYARRTGPLRRPRPVRCPAPHCGQGAGDTGLRAQGVLDHRRQPGDGGTGLQSGPQLPARAEGQAGNTDGGGRLDA